LKKKTDPRHQARRRALQTLFSWSFHEDKAIQPLESHIFDDEDLSAPHSNDLYSVLIDNIPTVKTKLNGIIEESAPEWPINQIARVDASILRIAIYELIYYPATPTKVAIDEAVELAKEFGGANSSKFVNGVLGTVVKKYVPEVPVIEKTEKSDVVSDNNDIIEATKLDTLNNV